LALWPLVAATRTEMHEGNGCMAEPSPKSRLETFCDGVFAIAITLLIIDVGIAEPGKITSTGELWAALAHAGPSIYAFLLSFAVIFITWVNHHNLIKFVDEISPAFIYANGALLLTVVLVPFPTSLLGEFVFTDHAAPAVVVYNAVFAVQALAWVLISSTALAGKLAHQENARRKIRVAGRNGYFGVVIYSVFAAAAFWIPGIVAIATTLLWIFWLVYGIRLLKDEG
jgi:uncharacterized membrane protein